MHSRSRAKGFMSPLNACRIVGRVGKVRTFSIGSVDFGGSGVGSESSFSIAVSSISVVSVPVEDVAIGEGSAMSLGLEA